MDLSSYLATWSRLHGVQPTPLVTFWLTQMHRLASPFVRARISPALISLSGVALTAVAVLVAWSSVPGRLTWAALAIAVAGLADGLDGAVAVQQRRESARGALVDAICDRISDLLLVMALWQAGAPAAVCCGLAVLFALHEYLRAAARGEGMRDTLITVAERPTRVIVVAAFLLAGGTAGHWTDDRLDVAGTWPIAGAWCALVLAVIGLVQLVRWLARTLP